MKNYILGENEVVLFKGMVALHSDWKELENNSTYNTEFLLTNENLVFINESDCLLPNANAQALAVGEIKIYENKIQIIRNKNAVEIYHKSGELYLQFELEKTAKEFCDKALKLYSGNTKFVRLVKTAEKIIKDNTEPLGIDAKELVKSTAKVALNAMTSRTSADGKGIGTTVRAVVNMIQNKKSDNDEQLLLEEEAIEG